PEGETRPAAEAAAAGTPEEAAGSRYPAMDNQAVDNQAVDSPLPEAGNPPAAAEEGRQAAGSPEVVRTRGADSSRVEAAAGTAAGVGSPHPAVVHQGFP
ncbi:MAG: hypothetical protein ACRDYC_03925, partial [Acidimicrobiales bacterium]